MLLGHQPLIVPFDFVIQPVQRGLHIRHARPELPPLFRQDGLPGRDGAVALAEQGHLFDEGLDLHTGLAHALHQLDPAAGCLVLIPDAAFAARHRRL